MIQQVGAAEFNDTRPEDRRPEKLRTKDMRPEGTRPEDRLQGWILKAVSLYRSSSPLDESIQSSSPLDDSLPSSSRVSSMKTLVSLFFT